MSPSRGLISSRNCLSCHQASQRLATGKSRPYLARATLEVRGQSTSSGSSDSGSQASSSTGILSTHSPRLRFAPSPTGSLHLGGLRTALLNHIVARQGKGKWILRIEDTDQERLVPGSVDALRKSLEWAGLEYDEGVGVGGSHGPYVQSERLDLYHHHMRELLDRDLAYECFCSSDELAAIRKSLHTQQKRVNYDSRCRLLSDEERKRRKDSGRPYIVRFKDPGQLPDLPHDLIFGEVTAHTDIGSQVGPEAAMQYDDFILMKSDGFPTYHLASVVDDHAMGITHVLRGEEWLSSLPKHIMLYHAFGWEHPLFAHLPVMVNPDGSKLSKRQADAGVDSYRDAGYEPEAVINYLALLGWDYQSSLARHLSSSSSHVTPNPKPDSQTDSSPVIPMVLRRDGHSSNEVFTLSQLVDVLDLTHLTKRRATVNSAKLDFLNKMHLRRKSGRLGNDGEMLEDLKEGAEDLKERTELIDRFQRGLGALPELQDNPLTEDRGYIERVFDLELPRVRLMKEMPRTSTYWFVDPDYTSQEAESMLAHIDPGIYNKVISTVIPLVQAAFEQEGDPTRAEGWEIARATLRKLDLKKRSSVLAPMRHAITGQKSGPSVPEVMPLLGEERVLSRLKAGLAYVQAKMASSTSN